MKKLILSAFLCLAVLQATWAKLTVTKEGNSTVVFTLEKANDIANEFTKKEWADYTASDLIKPFLGTTRLKIVTKPGVTMSTEDLKRICGMAEEENNFPNLNTLDLELANVTNDADLVNLKYMDKLKTITFPRTTLKIPRYCLKDASCKIEHVIIPDNDTRSVEVGSQPFGPSLKTIKLGAVDRNGDSKLMQHAFLECTELTSVDFGYGWKEIGRQAFMDCTALKNVTLPEGVEVIHFGAFSGSAIEAIHLPSTLKKIESTSFRCHYLKSIVIPAGVEMIERQAFQENKALTDVYVLGTHTKAGNQAFEEWAVSQFDYKNPDNVVPVKREFYRKREGSPTTMLHYPREAQNDYINEHSLHEGGSTDSKKAEGGNFWPTVEDGKYSVTQGDYAGWKNFALSTQLQQEETWEDGKRVDGKWYTMCLPFDMTAQQLKSAYGSKVEVVEFSGVEVVTKSNRDKQVILKFKKPVTETKAHHPYMIHPALHKGTTSGVKTTIAGVKKQEEKAENLLKTTHEADGVTYTFIGNYEKEKHLQQYSYYYYSGDDETTYKNGFYKWVSLNSGKWTPYTACVLMSKDNGAKAKAAVSYWLETPDGQTTAIRELPATPSDSDMQQGKVHNASGQLVRQGTPDLKTLPHGIYIINGKKYIVR